MWTTMKPEEGILERYITMKIYWPRLNEETQMLWARNTLRMTYKDNPARSSPEEEETGQIEEELGWQHAWLNRD